jgi:tetratricopeptide (TPR) repeat protein
VYALLGKEAEAQADYTEALKREPDDSNIAWTVCWSRFKDQPPTVEELERLEEIATFDQGHYTSNLCLAVIALHQQDLPQAMREVALAIEKDDLDQWDPPFWMAMIQASLGQKAAAQESLKQAQDRGLPPSFLAPLAWLSEPLTV